jgi:3-hydroxyacyl-[acyl-carrier-protein] dehydratase
MRFELVDRILEIGPERIVTLKQVSMAEEYLQDHFATFPVLPGVMMLEAMVQAGRHLAEHLGHPLGGTPLVLGRVRALKYGQFVKPGAGLRVEVTLVRREGDSYDLKGEGSVVEPRRPQADEAMTSVALAVSGRFTLRPARLGSGGGAGRLPVGNPGAGS